MTDSTLQEVVIPFGGKDYTVRPSFRLVSRIEAETGRSARALAVEMYKNDISVTAMATVLSAMLRDLKGPTVEEAGDIITRDGYMELLPTVALFLFGFLKGHSRHMKQAAAEAEGQPAGDPPQG